MRGATPRPRRRTSSTSTSSATGSGATCSTTGDFCERYGIDGAGAVLVRPDGYVAWRSRQLPDGDCAAVLTDVMKRVLSLK